MTDEPIEETPLTDRWFVIETKLGEPLAGAVERWRFKGLSWREVSLNIRDLTNVDVTPETLRLWFP